MADLSFIEQVRLRGIMRERFDPDQDGYGIGADNSDAVLEAANWVVGHQDTGLARDYFERIQVRDLLA